MSAPHAVEPAQAEPFAALGPGDPALAGGRTVALAAGDALFREGDPADHLFAVLGGTFEVVREPGARPAPGARALAVSTFGPGEFGGEVPLLSGTPHLATGRARTDAAVFVVGAEAFWSAMGRSRPFRDRVLANMAVRAAELERAAAEAERVRAAGALMAEVAHEVQNPLNFVVNFSGLNAEILGDLRAEIDRAGCPALEADPLLGAAAENARRVDEHGRRAAAAVRDMAARVGALGLAPAGTPPKRARRP